MQLLMPLMLLMLLRAAKKLGEKNLLEIKFIEENDAKVYRIRMLEKNAGKHFAFGSQLSRWLAIYPEFLEKGSVWAFLWQALRE